MKRSTSPSSLSRRGFVQLGALGAGLAWSGCSTVPRAPVVVGRLRHAAVGVGGMGAADLERIGDHPAVDVTALCDVDEERLGQAAAKFPAARTFTDWRVMFTEAADAFDSVHVTTPDHMHAPVALEALARGKHVYCQKPLTRTVAEARLLAEAARRSGSVTQMGIQNRSGVPYAQAHALFRAGHIGRVHGVHVWTDRPRGWWPQDVDRPAGSDPVPAGLHWDLWLGVSPERPYKQGLYHPFAWRGWKDFGTGAQGDMGCHLMDPALWFLELAAPLGVRSFGPPPREESFPAWSRVEYSFAPTRHTTRGPLRLTWHDGGKRVYREILDDLGAPAEVYANACLFLGTEGALLASPYEPPLLLGNDRLRAVPVPVVRGTNHWHQYVDACRGRGAVSAGFEYSAHLTEVVLLGNVALHFPHETLAWDAAGMRFPARPGADALLRPGYRRGWG